MSSNNYYGFTHAGTQFGAAYTPITPAPQSNAYSIPTHMYSGRPNYDQSYQQAPNTANAIPTTYSYGSRQQTSAASYSNDSNQYAQTIGYPYTAGVSTYTNSYNSVVANYATSALFSQQATSTSEDVSSAPVYSTGKTNTWNFKGKNVKGNKAKIAPKVQQLHYCEVCKISCAGPQTYKEHLEGQRHKKKEAQMKSGNQTTSKRVHGASSGISLVCELCDVVCTGNDAYAAHIRGSKHQKVLKLHTKLGKPIPANQPTVTSSSSKANQNKSQSIIPNPGKIKVLGTPRINFIGGGRLHTTQTGEVKEDSFADSQNKSELSEIEEEEAIENMEQTTALEDKQDAQPIGQDYIEEMRTDDGKGITFHCKLCDCKFNDPNAKEMHLKGRRHRLQYKKKVDPSLVVEIKGSLKHRKPDFRDKKYNYKHDMYYWNDYYNRYSYDVRPPLHSPMLPPLIPPPPPPPMYMGGPSSSIFRRNNNMGSSWDDAHIMQKHSEICPKEDELDEIHHVVSCTERALKLVSDKLADDDAASVMNEIINRELGNELQTALNNGGSDFQTDNQQNANLNDKSKEGQQYRMLKGLMRVGALAKGLLLTGDREVDLIVICAEKPTKHLLQRVVDHLPQQLQVVSSAESFEIIIKPHEASLSVCSTIEPKIIVNVTFTSPLVREESVSEVPQAEMVKEPKQYLDKQKCLDALAALRHAKWFQARVADLQPCTIIIRLLRDLCKRLPTWSKLNLWSVELLCEKVISSAGEPLNPGEALRHTFEALASGLLLPGGSGLIDPCEKEPTDALANLTRQEREDITSSAQHALRLIAFRQIYKILGVDPIQHKRKRRNDSSEIVNENESELKKQKSQENVTEENILQDSENGQADQPDLNTPSNI